MFNDRRPPICDVRSAALVVGLGPPALLLLRPVTEADDRHKAKMIKRKAVQDAEVAAKPVLEKGLLIVHTGPGKGKSTAAFGLVLRALGRGFRVGVVQFIKGAWTTGERMGVERFGTQIEWRTMGEGFTWETQDRARDVAAAQAAPREGTREARHDQRLADIGARALDHQSACGHQNSMPSCAFTPAAK